jgi:hypothetical protein
MRAHLIPANFPRDVRGLFLTPDEQDDANDLLSDLKCFEKVNKALQGQGKTKDTPRLTVAQSRKVLDALIKKFPIHVFTKINADSPLVTHPTWEKAISKLQNNREDLLSAAEKREVKRYLIIDAVASDDDSDGKDDEDDDDFNVMEILEAQEKEAAARENKSKYRCTKHILTTSTVVECLFSRAKLILCDKRSGMTPHHVEMLLFLYCNKDLWREAEVHKCTQDPFWSDDEDEAEELVDLEEEE